MKVPLKIYAVGDMMLGEQPLCNNFGVSRIIRQEGVDFLFNDVRSLFNGGDIVFGNLECSIMDESFVNGQESKFFCADPGIVEGLKNANFNVLSVANNHIMEHKEFMFQNTVRLLKCNNIHPVGISNNIEIMSYNEYKIAFMAYSFIDDNISNPCYNKIHSEESILHDIKKISSIVDLVIISIHWGSEYVPYPSPEQVRIGRTIVDAGADIILGGHPHVTQGFEMYKNKPIIYSLGNFIFDHTYIPRTNKSFIAEISVNDSPVQMQVNIIPIMIRRDNFQPQVASPSQQKEIISTVDSIRKSLENHSLSDYSKFIGNYEELCHKYKVAAGWNMRIQFIRNFYRYSPSSALSMIKQYFNKRISDKI